MHTPVNGKLGRICCAIVLAALIGCKSDAPYVVPEEPMPANTVMLSQMMRELSATPGFTEAVLAELDKSGKQGPALMTPVLMHRLRELILGKDWQGLDRFPGWTMQEINPTVRVAGRIAGKNEALQDLAARHPGSPKSSLSTAQAKQFIDLGPYTLEHAETVDLDKPSQLPGFTRAGLVSDLGAGVLRGDDANPQLAPLHAESQRIADVLNRLSLNGLDDAPQATAKLAGKNSATPEALIQTLIDSGHTVTVWDARYFANFGHFHYKGQDVMMPFWVSSQIKIPGTKRTLLIPVSHAEYEWQIRGPKINADVSWYFGVDGKAEFRTMDTLDQPWVLVRHAHEYRNADALEVTRLTGRMSIAYMHQHQARPTLPFGGYYALGVCQDSVAAIEKKMTGNATLFPNTADGAFFDDPRDAEVNALLEAIPKDRNGKPPEPERIFGSLPTADLNAITIPGLTADLVAVQTAWHDGSLERTQSWTRKMLGRLLGISAAALLLGIVVVKRRRSR
ncbi:MULTISPECIES: hypothetical protein [Acidobacteriaceae]|uniref:hypothetical protein n=1 Tax=Acidobacteriaceae TaxID=204434 RepID=UPI0020B13E6E|nr:MULTISPECIES: hypothetical protein [Acidobacteriaceae]MDW5267023.1 hypothetical protein [Edaphobacter sp.]